MTQRLVLGELLLLKQWITEDQLMNGLQFQKAHGMPLGKSLIELGYLTPGQLKKALRRQTRIRFLAACAAFLMAPFAQLCQAQDDLESYPEYSLTQVADLHHSVSGGDFNQLHSDGSFDVLELTTAALWYLSQGGVQDNELTAIPVSLHITSTQPDSYAVNISLSF